MAQALIDQLIAFYQTCESYKGLTLNVKSYLSTNQNNYDRHCTSYSEMEFVLTHFGVRFSGNRACFYGHKQSYEIAGDLIKAFDQIAEKEFEILEIYSGQVYRCSKLRFA